MPVYFPGNGLLGGQKPLGFTASSSGGGIGYPAVAGQGLTVTVLPFRVGDFQFSGGKIEALDNLSQFVGVNVRTGRLHCLPRLGDHGFIPVAKVVAAAGALVSVSCMPPSIEPTRIPRVLAKLANGEDVKVTVLGSSLLYGADAPTQHLGLLLLPSDVEYGYSALVSKRTSALNADPDFALASVNFEWGAPTGYSVLPSGGPNDSACIEWSGGGRLFRQIVGANKTYFASLRAIPVTGAPTVTIQVKDVATDTVRGTSGAVSVSGITSVAASGLTAGANGGCRIEILVSGGTVRLADMRISAYPLVTIRNASVGGSGAALALAITGSPFKVPVASFYSDANTEITVKSAASWNLNGPEASPMASIMDADLVIVGGLANPATNRDLMHEPLLYALRSAGCEVVLVTDNAASPSASNPETWSLYSDGYQLLKSADAYGVGVADTAAYMAEAFLRGLPVYRDAIHQSYGIPSGAQNAAVSTGHECWAESLAGVVSPAIDRAAILQGVPTFRAQDVKQPGQAKVVLAGDIKTSGTASTLGAVGVGITGYSDFCGLFGAPANKRRLMVPVGGIVHLSHPAMISSQLLIQGKNFSADVRINNATTLLRTINFVAGAGGARPTLLDAAFLSDFGVTSFANLTVTIHVTSGELWLLAGVVHTPLYEDITDDVLYGGPGWGKEASLYLDVACNYTDTVNSFMSARHSMCRSIVVGTSNRSQSGTVVPYHDGLQLEDLSLAGTAQMRYKTFSGQFLGPHVVTFKLKTAGAAPVAQNRSMGIVQVFAVLDR